MAGKAKTRNTTALHNTDMVPPPSTPSCPSCPSRPSCPSCPSTLPALKRVQVIAELPKPRDREHDPAAVFTVQDLRDVAGVDGAAVTRPQRRQDLRARYHAAVPGIAGHVAPRTHRVLCPALPPIDCAD